MRPLAPRALVVAGLLALPAGCARDLAPLGPSFATVLGPRTPLPKPNAWAEGLAINNKGIMVGFASSAATAAHTGARWPADAAGMVELGTPDDVVGASYAYAINDLSVIGGSWYADEDPTQSYRPWWRAAGGVPVQLPMLSGAANAQGEVRDIAENGLAVGWSTIPPNERAVTWLLSAPFTITDITPAGATNGRALGVNASGAIAGWATFPAGVRAVIWTAGVPVALGTLGGAASRATDINGDGCVVGYSNNASGDERAFIYCDAGAGMVELPLLPGAVESGANAISGRGDIAGWMRFGGGVRPVIWERGSFAPVDLEPDDPLVEAEAIDINNRGDIVGTEYSLAGNSAVRWKVAIANAPSASLEGPATAVEGQSVQFSAAASSDPDGDELAYAWDFGDGATSNVRRPRHTFTDQGAYDVWLWVEDPSGRRDSATVTVTVANQRPVPVLSVADIALLSGEEVSADVSFTDPGTFDVAAASFLGWGDGTSTTSGLPAAQNTIVGLTHRYTVPGTYRLVYRVTDEAGAVREAVQQITVTRVPVQMLTSPATLVNDPDVNPRVTVTLLGSAAFDAVQTLDHRLGDGNGEEARVAGAGPVVVDANFDGFNDLRMEFRVKRIIADGDFTTNSADLVLTGRHTDGRRFTTAP